MTLRLKWVSVGIVIGFALFQLVYWYETHIRLEGLLTR